MATVCKTVPVTAGAVGTPVSVSDLGAAKTIIITKTSGSLKVQAGIGGQYCDIKVTTTPLDFEIEVVCDEIRVDATNGSGDVSVSAERAQNRFTTLPGDGTPVDVTQFGDINSATCVTGGANVKMEISQDYDPGNPSIATWAQVFKNFTGPACQTANFSACWARSMPASGGATASDIELGAQESAVGASLSEPRDGIVYAPDIPNPSGNVYDNWEDAHAAAVSLANSNYFAFGGTVANTGFVNLYVISKYSTYDRVGDGRNAAPIPAGTWDMTGIALCNGNNFNGFSGLEFVCRVEFLDGAKVPGLGCINAWSSGGKGHKVGPMDVSNASTTNTPIDGSFSITLTSYVRLQALTAGLAPLIKPFFGFLAIWTDNFCQIGNSGSQLSLSPLIDLAGEFVQWQDSGSALRDSTLTDSVGGAVLRYLKRADGQGIETPITSWSQPDLDAAGAVILGNRPAARLAHHSTFNPLNSFDSPFDGKPGPILEIFDVDTSLYTSAYDGGNGTGFAAGESLTFGAGGTGTVFGATGDGVTGSILYSLDSGSAPLNDETISSSGGGAADADGAASQDPVSLSLPRSKPMQSVAYVKDFGGNASGANITVDLSIGGGTDTFEDGTQTDVLSTDYGAAKYVSNGFGIWRRMSI